MDKNCEWCGSVFSKSKKLSEDQWNARRFCSKQCSGMKAASIPESLIAEMYVSGMSSEDIASLCGKTGRGVRLVLSRMGIEIRSQSQAMKISHSRKSVKSKISESRKGTPCPEHVKNILKDRIGSKNHNWKSGLTVSDGYWYFTNSIENGENAGRALHCVIAEIKIGRKLKDEEVVHHKDHDRMNNDPENLQICSSQSEHMEIHVTDARNGIGKKGFLGGRLGK